MFVLLQIYSGDSRQLFLSLIVIILECIIAFHVFIPGVVVGGAGVPVKNIHKSVQILSVIIVVLLKTSKQL